jgi:hypothetical protein
LGALYGTGVLVFAGLQFEKSYRERVGRLPNLVDANGHTSPVETAIASLDDYGRALQIRRCGFAGFGVAFVLGGVFVFTKDKA